MTELTQLYTIDEHGKGDCWRTCIACLLDKATPDEVPMLVYNEDGTLNDEWFASTLNWLQEQGLWMKFWEYDPAVDQAPVGYFITSGYTGRVRVDGTKILHAVIGMGNEVVHDPHPTKAGLTQRLFDVFEVVPISAA